MVPDPVLNEVIQSTLEMAVEEGGLAAGRAAGSTFISSSTVIACALFDLDGRQVAQTAGGLLHVSALRVMLPELLARYPLDSFVPADVYILNSPFLGGIHPTDVGAFRPVFHDGELVFFAATMMIVSDLGGMAAGGLPANATETFHEGIVIPPVAYMRGGRADATVQGFIRSNSRVPDKVIDQLIDYAEHMARLDLRKIPDGRYEGVYGVEADGVETDREFVVRCAIEIADGHCRVNFAGTDRQARGPINSSFSQTLSAAVYGIRCYLDANIPMNEGLYKVIEIDAPAGTLVNPEYPAACNLRMGTVHAILDAINGALIHAFPQRAGAPGSTAVTLTISGAAPGKDGAWSLLDCHFGVGGGRLGMDGVDGTPSPIYASAGWDRSIEAYEWEYPIEYECFALLPDTGGPGRWRGATGMVKTMRFMADGWLTVRSTDRFDRPPPGLDGGGSGGKGSWIVNEGTPDEVRLPARKTNHLVRAGDRLTLISAGGGGMGDPHARDPEAVATDVRLGFVTRERAMSDYAVEIGPDGSGRRPDPSS